ncbi:MAG: quinolinate synthase NadA [Spirochaetales bacterium]|nr:quinolinate synthase NadA [Spirochaetales bacterium]
MLKAEELYKRLQHVKVGATSCRFTLAKCEEITPLINEINQLKKEKQAIILVHSYVDPDIVYGVADFVGDSYGLSKDAMSAKGKIIVFAAVKFMAETAKILNPDKTVLVPAIENGCSLADSITAEDVRRLKAENPDYAFMCYINTSAEVKAECDVCVTSSNVYKIVENYPSDKIFFVPDRLMGLNIIEEMAARGVKKSIKLYDGTCYVHEDYKPEMIEYLKLEYPDLKVASHPECSSAVVKYSDFVGSTSQLIDYIRKSANKNFLLLTECGLISRLNMELPEKRFIGSCTMCKYMKANTLQDILRVLKAPESKDIIEIEESTRKKALNSINAMFKYAE